MTEDEFQKLIQDSLACGDVWCNTHAEFSNGWFVGMLIKSVVAFSMQDSSDDGDRTGRIAKMFSEMASEELRKKSTGTSPSDTAAESVTP